MLGLKRYRQMSNRKQSVISKRYRTRGMYSKAYKRYRRMQLQFEQMHGKPEIIHNSQHIAVTA